jgi:hypothetical protein
MGRLLRIGIVFSLACLVACGGGSVPVTTPTAPVAPLAISTPSGLSAMVGTPIGFAFAATGGTPPYHWSIAAGALPPGITLNAEGALAGTPSVAGTSSVTVAVTDAGATAQTATRPVSIQVAPAILSIATAHLPSATANAAYAAPLAAAGGTAPYAWSVKTGALPTGITLGPAGTLSGVPTTGGTATFTVQVTDAGTPVQTATATLILAVAVSPLAVTTTALGGATTNGAYAATLAASGGAGAYRWSIGSGALPAGISLSATGALAGIPTTPGIATFGVTVEDGSSPPLSASQSYNLVVAAAGAVTQVTLGATPSGISIGSSFAGLSYEKNKLSSALFSPSNTSLIALFSRLGPDLLRIGGNSVDDTLWNASGPGETAHEVSPADVQRLAGFLAACNWKVLYGIEFLNEQASPVALTDPSLVAAEAVNVMQTLGDSLYGFELGNEPDLYDNKIAGFTYPTFQAQWQTYRDAILNAVAAAKAAGTLPPTATPQFTGPAAAYNQAGYVTPFAQAEAANIFLLTRHYYVANGQDPTSTMTLLLTPDPNLPPDLAAMQAAASSNRIASGYRMSEANSFYNGGAPGISDAFGTALWAINFLFTNAWAGSSGVNFHGGGDGTGYTPIGDDGTAAVSVRPEYYGIDLFAQAANGQLIATTSTPMVSSLDAYAVAAGNTTNVMLVNTSATAAENVRIAFNANVTSARFVTLTGPSLGSTTGQLMGGAAIGTDGTWTPAPTPPVAIPAGNLLVPVPAGSALLLIVH